MNKKIIFTGGGTAGHVYPGLSIIESLEKKDPELDILWIGSNKGIEGPIITQAGVKFLGVPSGKLRRYFSFQNFTDLFKILAGAIKALFIIGRLKPDLVFSKGGFVSVPPVFAAGVRKVTVISHESDVTPGLATRLNSRFSEKIFVSYKQTLSYIAPGKGIVTGNPVRAAIFNADAEKGRKAAGASDRQIIMVIGGSQGALQINRLVEALIPELTERYVVVHQAGKHEFNGDVPENYIRREYINMELPDLMAAASIIISRAGASTLWEIAAIGRPSILVPLGTGASRGDQGKNAAVFKDAGASIVLEGDVTPAQLLKEIRNLMENESLRKKMSESVSRLVNGNPADIIADEIMERLK